MGAGQSKQNKGVPHINVIQADGKPKKHLVPSASQIKREEHSNLSAHHGSASHGSAHHGSTHHGSTYHGSEHHGSHHHGSGHHGHHSHHGHHGHHSSHGSRSHNGHHSSHGSSQQGHPHDGKHRSMESAATGLKPPHGKHRNSRHRSSFLSTATAATGHSRLSGHSHRSGASQRTKDGNRKYAIDRQMEEYKYPSPFPLKKKKEEYYDANDYKRVDQRAMQMPVSVMYSHYEQVVEYLTSPYSTELEKLRCIFFWTTYMDVGDQRFTLDTVPNIDTPLEYLLEILWKIGNHAHLFTTLCRLAGLTCITIYGVTKSSVYKLGGTVERPAMSSQWNAVYFDGSWKLVDLLWASTCAKGNKNKGIWSVIADDDKTETIRKKEEVMSDEEEKEVFELDTRHYVNEFFFLTDPGELIYTHFPDDPAWQLLPYNISQQDYEHFAYVRERYWQLNMDMHPSVEDLYVKTDDGMAKFLMKIPTANCLNVSFHYLLFKHAGSESKLSFAKYVFYEKRGCEASYSIRFPVVGEFRFDIYGADTDHYDHFDLCVSFLVECSVAHPNLEPYPDNPDIGWGAGDALTKANIAAVSHKDPLIRTDNGLVEIRFEAEDPSDFMANLKHNTLGENALDQNVYIYEDKVSGQVVVQVRLNEKGEYALNLYVADAGKEGELTNVCNYLIENTNEHQHPQYPKLYEKNGGKGFMADCFYVEATSHKEPTIESENGKLDLQFKTDEDVELFMEIQNNKIHGSALAKCIQHEREGEEHHFELNLPQEGEYAVNVFARTAGEDGQVYHAYTYLVNSKQKEFKEMPAPLTDKPVVEEMEVTGALAVINLPKSQKKRTTNLRRVHAHDVMLRDQVILDIQNDQDTYYITMPENGEYMFEVFEEDENGTVTGSKQYSITRKHGDDEEHEEEDGVADDERQRRNEQRAKEAKANHYKDKLQSAIDSHSVTALRKAIEDAEMMHITECADLIKRAKRHLSDLQKMEDIAHVVAGLQECPDIGWGPGEEATAMGIHPITHPDPVITTSTGEVEVRFRIDEEMTVHTELKANNLDIDEDELQNRVMTRIHNGEMIVTMRLDDKGEYALNIYSDKADASGQMANICNYVIKNEQDTELAAFPQLHEEGLGKGRLADELEVVPMSHLDDVIKTHNGKMHIDFALPDNMEMVVQLHNAEYNDRTMAQCVSVDNSQSEAAKIKLDLPESGEYGLTAFVRDKNNPTNMHHVHTYMVKSFQKKSRDIQELPETEMGTIPMNTSGSTCLIPLPEGYHRQTAAAELIRVNAQGEFIRDQVQIERIGNQEVMKVKTSDLGEYKLELFSADKNGALHNVMAYQIFREEQIVDEIPQEPVLTDDELKRLVAERDQGCTLPDLPEIGWGPGNDLLEAGLRAVTHEQAVIEAQDGEVELRFHCDNPVHIIQNLKGMDLNEVILKQNAMTRIDNKEVVVNVRLPDEGDFALKLYTDQRQAEGELPNVCNYLIKSRGSKKKKTYPKFHEGGIGKGFFADQFHVKAVSHPGGKIQTDLGVVGIEFEAPSDVEIVYEVCSNDIDNHLSDCVKVNADECQRAIDLILPKEGEYAVNVYARKQGDAGQIYHVHTYFIESFQSDSQDLPPPPPPPEIVTIHVTTPKCIIKIPSGKRGRTTELLKKNQLFQLPNQIRVEYDNKVDIYEVKLQEYGEYRFDVFEDHGNGTVDHIRQYQIFRDEPAPPPKELSEEEKAKIKLEQRRKTVLDKLQAALLAEDELMVKVMVKEFESIIEDPKMNSDVIRAKRLLEHMDQYRELENAIKGRNLQDLQRLINMLEHQTNSKALKMLLIEAKKELDHLLRLEKLKHEVLKMDNRAFAEIRSYTNPPAAVYKVLFTTFMLLGEQEKTIKEWKTIMVMMGKMGKESLKRRIAGFRPHTLPIDVARRAKTHLKECTFEEAQVASAGAGTFYVWNEAMIEECEKLFLHSDASVIGVGKRESGTVASKNKAQSHKLSSSVPLPTAIHTGATPGAPPAKTTAKKPPPAAAAAAAARSGPNSKQGRAGPGGGARAGPNKYGSAKRK